ERLFALHRAHVALVPYENIDIQLGRPPSIDPYASAERIIAGRGGYCYHLNGAFALLLTELGYDVSRHVGGVFSRARPAGVTGGHAALTVRVGGGEWFVDVGLGDALFEPMPLTSGRSRQGPFVYRLEPSPVAPGGWRFWHAANAGSFAGMDFTAPSVGMDAFADMHDELSTSPSSPFVMVAQVGRRTANGLDFLRGCHLRTVSASGSDLRALTSADEWYGVLDEVFDLPLTELDDAVRAALWDRLWSAHERFLASLR
ncbi:MAG TPA: arylamine N-acetyltransferase, partial [Micromonosporaceae bacterium]